MTKQGPMTTVVLEHEQADKKAGGRNSEQQIKPVSGVERQPHQRPETDERHDGDQYLEEAAPVVWIAIPRETALQNLHMSTAATPVTFIRSLNFTG
jgi:hypothetical protein